MTPKEKANYLIRKMTVDFTIEYPQTRLAALACCDEIINVHYKLNADNSGIGENYESWQEGIGESYHYWQGVKKELEML